MFGLSACNTKSIKFKELKINAQFHHLNGKESSLAIIRSHQELVDFYSEYSHDWMNNEPIWNVYKDDYFNKKAIIVYLYYESGSNVNRYVNEVMVDDSVLTLKMVWKLDPNAGINCDHGLYVHYVEVSKDKIKNVTAIEVDVEVIKIKS